MWTDVWFCFDQSTVYVVRAHSANSTDLAPGEDVAINKKNWADLPLFPDGLEQFSGSSSF
jgi:hypothetical protein